MEYNETANVTNLRNSLTGKLPVYTNIGCYSLFYYDSDYTVLCAQCANDNDSYS